MYPLEILTLFPAFPRNNKVFVATPFGEPFDSRWTSILEPAIESVEHQGRKLEAHRADLTRVSDSIVTEIVKDIAECRLFLADVSVVGAVRSGLKRRWVRNSNVFYEVGIAHASRLQEEVILVRADDKQLDFDISGIRVSRFSSGNPARAQQEIQLLIEDALKAVNTRRLLAVERGVSSLDYPMYALLQQSLAEITHPAGRGVLGYLESLERTQAIYRLVAAGMFRTVYKPLTNELMAGAIPLAESVCYEATPYGREVFLAARDCQGFNDAMKEWLKTAGGKNWLEYVARVSERKAQPPPA